MSETSDKPNECPVCGAPTVPIYDTMCKDCRDAERRHNEAIRARRRYARWPEANPWKNAR